MWFPVNKHTNQPTCESILINCHNEVMGQIQDRELDIAARQSGLCNKRVRASG